MNNFKHPIKFYFFFTFFLLSISCFSAERERNLDLLYSGKNGYYLDFGITSKLEKFFLTNNDITVKAIYSKEIIFNNQNFLFRYPSDFNISNSEIAFEKKIDLIPSKILKNDKNIIFQYPPTNRDLTGEIVEFLKSGKSPFENYKFFADEGKFFQLKTVIGDELLFCSPEGLMPVLSNRWDKTLALVYELEVNGKTTKFFIIGKIFGGISAISELVTKEKKENPDLIAVDNGGTYEENNESFEKYLNLLKELAYDVFVPRGEGISKNISVLENFSLKNRTPEILSANLFKSGKPVFNSFIVKNIKGIRVGFTGISYHSQPEDAKNLVFADPVKELPDIIKKLRDETDFIVLVSNYPEEINNEISKLFPEITLIFSNNSEDTIPFPDEGMAGDNLTASSTVTGKLSEGANIGRVTLYFNGENEIVSIVHKREPLSYTYTENQELRVLDEKNSTYFNENREILLPDPRKIWKNKIYLEEKSFYNLISRYLLEATSSEVSLIPVLPFKSNFPGEITSKHIHEWLETEQKITSFYLTGAELIEIKKRLEIINEKNLKYFYDGIDISDPENLKIHGLPIKADEQYKLISTDLMLDKKLEIPELSNASDINDLFMQSGESLHENKSGTVYTLEKFVVSNLKTKMAVFEQETRTKIFKAVGTEVSRLYQGFQNKKIEVQAELDHYIEKEIKNIEAVEETRYLSGLKKEYEENYVKIIPIYNINIEELSLNLSNTGLKNNGNFNEVRNAKVTGKNQAETGGRAKAYFEVNYEKYNLKLLNDAIFNKISIQESPDKRVTNENADDLVLSLEGYYKWLYFLPFSSVVTFGPFINIAFDTEFFPNKDTLDPTLHLSREMVGRSIIGGKFKGTNILEDFSVGEIIDLDFSNNNNFEHGLYSKLELSKTINFFSSDIKFSTLNELKYFVDSKQDSLDDLGVEFSTDNKLTIPVIGHFSLAPFVNVFIFRGKEPELRNFASYLNIGVALQFSRSYKPQFQNFLNF